jgi:hypothetical protein
MQDRDRSQTGRSEPYPIDREQFRREPPLPARPCRWPKYADVPYGRHSTRLCLLQPGRSLAPRNVSGTEIHDVDCPFFRNAPCHAESHDCIAIVRGIPFAGGRPQQPGRKHPRAAAINSKAIALGILRRVVARSGLVRTPVGRASRRSCCRNSPRSTAKRSLPCRKGRMRSAAWCPPDLSGQVRKKDRTLFRSRSWH